MNSTTFNQKLVTVLLTGLAIWSLWYLHEVILLVFLAIIIAIGISLPAKWLQGKGVSKTMSMVMSGLLVAIGFTLIIVWLVPLLATEIQDFVLTVPQYLEQLQVKYQGTGIGDIINSLVGVNNGIGNSDAGANNIEQLFNRFVDNGLPVVFSGAGILVSVVTNLLLVLIISIMLLVEPKKYVKGLLYVTPKSAHQPLLRVLNKIYTTIKAWLASLSFSILFTTVAVFIGMVIVGVPNPAAIAMFAALATFIPNIGSIIPLIPIALFTIGVSTNLFLLAAVVYLGIQLIESNVFTPMVVESKLDIPVAGILIFQILAGFLFGLLGVLLAVPLLATIIVIVKELVSKHHYGYDTDSIKLKVDDQNNLYLS